MGSNKFRLRNASPFGIMAISDCLRHLSIGLARIVFKQSRLRFIEAMRNRGLPVSPVVDIKETNCSICGYANAAINNRDGWTVRGCSATFIARIVENPGFSNWYVKVVQVHRSDVHTSDKDMHSEKGDLSLQLQTSGH